MRCACSEMHAITIQVIQHTADYVRLSDTNTTNAVLLPQYGTLQVAAAGSRRDMTGRPNAMAEAYTYIYGSYIYYYILVRVRPDAVSLRMCYYQVTKNVSKYRNLII